MNGRSVCMQYTVHCAVCSKRINMLKNTHTLSTSLCSKLQYIYNVRASVLARAKAVSRTHTHKNAAPRENVYYIFLTILSNNHKMLFYLLILVVLFFVFDLCITFRLFLLAFFFWLSLCLHILYRAILLSLFFSEDDRKQQRKLLNLHK